MLTIFHLPEFDYSIVCGQELERAILVVVQELKRINLLIKLNTLKMIEFWLVRLDL